MSEAVAALPERQVHVPPEINPWFIALTVTLATFMEVLDTSIANVSLPHIAGGLAAGVDESTWILTSMLCGARRDGGGSEYICRTRGFAGSKELQAGRRIAQMGRD